MSRARGPLLVVLIIILHGGVPVAQDADSQPIERVFTHGLWGDGPRRYQPGLDAFLADMRRHYLNVHVCAPGVGEGDDGLAAFEGALDAYERHGVFVLPHAGTDPARLSELASTVKGREEVLAWYIRDEPNADFIPEFAACREAIDSVAPHQPAVCLFYRPDSAAAFSPLQPIMLTDCYPIAYSHGGTSLGPHFARRSEGLALDDGMSRYNMFGRHGVAEWMDLLRGLTGGQAHWITLQVFESGNSHTVRWRDPTGPELRLMVYQALAGGAKGINYFRYGTMTDEYANPRPARHGEHGALWDEVGRIGREIVPIGQVLLNAEPIDEPTVVAAHRPSYEPGDRIETRRLRSTTRDVDYIVATNNDTVAANTGEIIIPAGLLRGRTVYDLHDLAAAPVSDLPAGAMLEVSIPPGGGRVFSVASAEDFAADAAVATEARCEAEVRIIAHERELLAASGAAPAEADVALAEYAAHAAAGEWAEAWEAIIHARAELREAAGANETLSEVREKLSQARHSLGALEGQPAEVHARLSAAYRALSIRMMAGDSRAIRKPVAALAEAVARLVDLAADGNLSDEAVDAKTLSTIESATEGAD